MRTTLIIPDALMQRVSRLSGETSKTKAVVAAMETYVKFKSREEEELSLQREREALLEGRG